MTDITLTLPLWAALLIVFGLGVWVGKGLFSTPIYYTRPPTPPPPGGYQPRNVNPPPDYPRPPAPPAPPRTP